MPSKKSRSGSRKPSKPRAHNKKAVSFPRNARFTNIRSSPWRRLTFTVQIDGRPGSWGHITNDKIHQALMKHLGFRTIGEGSYLEIKYHSIQIKLLVAGSALALRVYRLGAFDATDPNPEVTASVESYASSSTTYPRVYLPFDPITRQTPLQGSNTTNVFAIYAHMTGDATSVGVCLIKLWYRHAETPFEDEPAFSTFLKCSDTTSLDDSVVESFEKLEI